MLLFHLSLVFIICSALCHSVINCDDDLACHNEKLEDGRHESDLIPHDHLSSHRFTTLSAGREGSVRRRNVVRSSLDPPHRNKGRFHQSPRLRHRGREEQQASALKQAQARVHELESRHRQLHYSLGSSANNVLRGSINKQIAENNYDLEEAKGLLQFWQQQARHGSQITRSHEDKITRTEKKVSSRKRVGSDGNEQEQEIRKKQNVRSGEGTGHTKIDLVKKTDFQKHQKKSPKHQLPEGQHGIVDAMKESFAPPKKRPSDFANTRASKSGVRGGIRLTTAGQRQIRPAPKKTSPNHSPEKEPTDPFHETSRLPMLLQQISTNPKKEQVHPLHTYQQSSPSSPKHTLRAMNQLLSELHAAIEQSPQLHPMPPVQGADRTALRPTRSPHSHTPESPRPLRTIKTAQSFLGGHGPVQAEGSTSLTTTSGSERPDQRSESGTEHQPSGSSPPPNAQHGSFGRLESLEIHEDAIERFLAVERARVGEGIPQGEVSKLLLDGLSRPQ